MTEHICKVNQIRRSAQVGKSSLSLSMTSVSRDQLPSYKSSGISGGLDPQWTLTLLQWIRLLVWLPNLPVLLLSSARLRNANRSERPSSSSRLFKFRVQRRIASCAAINNKETVPNLEAICHIQWETKKWVWCGSWRHCDAQQLHHC